MKPTRSNENQALVRQGRQPLLVADPDLAERLALALLHGLYFDQACAIVGLNRSTAYDWLQRGEAGEAPFCEFSDTIKKAQAEAELADLAVIEKAAAEGTWQAAAWRLERKHPKRWGRRSQGDEISAPVTMVDPNTLSSEDLKAMLTERGENLYYVVVPQQLSMEEWIARNDARDLTAGDE